MTEHDSQLKKQQYFFSLGRSVPDEMQLFRTEGMLGTIGSQDDWRNVRRHTAVAMARCTELAEMTHLSNDLSVKLKKAAFLHDVTKKEEVKILRSKNFGFDGFLESGRAAEAELMRQNVDPEVIEITKGAGVQSFMDMDELLMKSTWSDVDIAKAILHYVDDYTIEDTWVIPAQDSEKTNDLDRRSLRQANKPINKTLDIEVSQLQIFGGETLHEAQRRIGHAIEKRLVDIITQRSNVKFAPLELPSVIDERIITKINSL